MKKKRLFYLLILFIVAFFLQWWFFPTPRINEETYQLISNGMSKQEVKGILRASPGDYGAGEIYNRGLEPNSDAEEWLGDNTGIQIYFSPDGKVLGKTIFWISRSNKTWFQKIGDFLSSW